MLSLHQILLTILIKIVVSQEPDGSCSCTPLVYKWKLDFTQSCPPADITVGNGAGVKDAFCTVKNGSNLTDLKPVSVTRYQIIELGQDLTPIKVKEESMITLKDGDEISFSSITGAQPSVVSGGLQVHMDGLNSADEKIVLEWIVRYSNLCEVYPYSDGNSLGWMEFVIRDDDAFPGPETCAEKSEVPSMSPTMSQTHSPTRLPSSQPSLRPSAKPITHLPTVETCFTVHFTTSPLSDSGSKGNFYILGYGYVPPECRTNAGAECDFTICGRNTLDIVTPNIYDLWRFTITGDVGPIVYHLENPNSDEQQEFGRFPTKMGGDYDGIQSYPLVDSSTSVAPVAATEAPTSTSVARNKAQDWIASRTDHSICFTVHFTTSSSKFSGSQDKFYILGYGYVPPECRKKSADCDITICGRNTLDIVTPNIYDLWRFTITGDIGQLVYHLENPISDKQQEFGRFPTKMGGNYDVIQSYQLEAASTSVR